MIDEGEQYSDAASQCPRQSFLHRKRKKIPLRVILCSQKLLWFKVRGCGGLISGGGRRGCRENLEISTPLRSSSPLHSFCLLLQLYMYIRAMFTEKYFSLELDLCEFFYPGWPQHIVYLPQGQSHLCTVTGSGL